MHTQLISSLLIFTCLIPNAVSARSLPRTNTTNLTQSKALPPGMRLDLIKHYNKLWDQCFESPSAAMLCDKITKQTMNLKQFNVLKEISIEMLKSDFQVHFSALETIPHTIHQIYLEETLSPWAKQQQENWLKTNPGWHYILWKQTDTILNTKLANSDYNYHEKKITEFEAQTLWPVIQKLYRNEDKADLLKYEILAQHGGLYANWNISSIASIEHFHKKHHLYLVPQEHAPHFISSDIIGAIKNHPTILRAIETIQKRSLDLTTTIYPAGIILITHALLTTPKKDLQHVTLLNTEQKQTLFTTYKKRQYTEHTVWWQAYQNIIPKKNKRFVIVVPSYNNDDWYYQNLQSIIKQEYPHYRVIYINDKSTDNTGKNVETFIKKHDTKNKISIIHNKTNKGGLANIYDAVHSAQDNEIIVELDGDDWFHSTHVLDLLNKVYAHGDTWITYGQYTQWPNPEGSIQPGIPPLFLRNKNFRGPWGWLAPLRTFYAWLFKKIDKNDLQINDQFLRVSWDHAFMWPMCEMANDHLTFIDDLLYVYNRANQLSDSSRHQEQRQVMNYLSNKKRYQKLDYHINIESDNHA